VHEADHLVDVLLVDGEARVLLGDDHLAQLLERGVGRDGDDVGPRRHDFAHHFVSELDHRLDQLAVSLRDEPFFGAGGYQRIDVLGGSWRFFLRGSGVGQVDQRLKEREERDQGPHRPCETAQKGRQRDQPLARRAAI